MENPFKQIYCYYCSMRLDYWKSMAENQWVGETDNVFPNLTCLKSPTKNHEVKAESLILRGDLM